jgi:class 3 adenylate cyclase
MSEPLLDGQLELDHAFAIHGPRNARTQLSVDAVAELTSKGSTPIGATVVVGDLRLSTFVLKEAVRPELFARFVIGFTEAIRSLAHSRDGWFDKFTGDGFIAFWLNPPDERAVLDSVFRFCQEVRGAAGTLIDGLRRNSRNFPVGVGLSIGIDSGPCELVRVGGALTLVGSPIVGATRMADCASAGETLANIYMGGVMERGGEVLATGGVEMSRVTARTKEYPEGQEAYRLEFL